MSRTFRDGGPASSEATVSIVLPTYRRPDLLERAMATVFAQTFTRWELLVIDDNGEGTPDQLRTEVVVRSKADSRLKYVVNTTNMGGGAARNAGIARARGEFVAFIDDDDAWEPEKLEAQLERFASVREDVALVYCRSRVVDESTGRTWLWPTDGTSHSTLDLLRKNTVGSTSLVLCRRSALVAVGGFDERLSARQDIDLYVRLSQRYTFAFLDRVLNTGYRHEGASIGKDLTGTIRAQELFLEKYREAIESDAMVHHYCLVALGKNYVLQGRYPEARRILSRAWRLRPFDRRGLVQLVLAFGFPRGPAAAIARATRRLTRAVR